MPGRRVAAESAGKRVDQIVAAMVSGLSMAAARRLVLAGAVRVDGRVARKGDRVAAGQLLEVDTRDALDPERTIVAPDATVAIAVLHADDALVAIAKPAGVPTHPLRAGQLGTAANALVARFPECATASPDAREAGLAHRLDTATSGVLVAARRAELWSRLRAALAGPDCEKTYLAEVVGTAEAGATSAPIGRVGRRGARVRVGAGRRPLPAHTEWAIAERRDGTTLVRAHLKSGRAHQVRAHLAAAGHPIVGDPKYGGPAAALLHLHALRVRFRHPISGELISVEAPAPGWAMMRA
jgi:23S rRNA pseudouridine1911/1915/1917 synthase